MKFDLTKSFLENQSKSLQQDYLHRLNMNNLGGIRQEMKDTKWSNFINQFAEAINDGHLTTGSNWSEIMDIFYYMDQVKPKQYLEVGIEHGASFYAALLALSIVHGPDQDKYPFLGIASDVNHDQWDRNYVDQRFKYSYECIGDFKTLVPSKFDMIRIDADHSYQFAVWYMKALHEFCNPGCIVLIHDFLCRPETELPDYDAERVANVEFLENNWPVQFEYFVPTLMFKPEILAECHDEQYGYLPHVNRHLVMRYKGQ